MADDRDDDKREQKKQATGGQQSHESEYGEQGRQSGQPIGGNDSETGSGTPLSQGAEPPRSMGTKGTEFGQFGEDDDKGQQGQSGTGQADLGSQAATTLGGHTDQQDLGQDQPGRVGGADSTGEGFIGAHGAATGDEYLRQRSPVSEKTGSSSPSSAKATDGTDFAREGRGAPEDEDEASSEGGTG